MSTSPTREDVLRELRQAEVEERELRDLFAITYPDQLAEFDRMNECMRAARVRTLEAFTTECALAEQRQRELTSGATLSAEMVRLERIHRASLALLAEATDAIRVHYMARMGLEEDAQ